MKSSGSEYEFVKLCDLMVGPCRACKACVKDNICKINDDFPALAKKVLDAKALVLSAIPPMVCWMPFPRLF